MNIEKVYKYFHKQVLKQVSECVENPSDAEDLAQDVWMRILEYKHTFDPKKSTVGTWLWKVTENVLKDQFSSMEKSPEILYGKEYDPDKYLDTEDAPENIPDLKLVDCLTPENLYRIEEIKNTIQKELESMSEDMKKTWELIVYEGVSYNEASFILKVPVGTVKRRMYDLNKKLQEVVSI